MKLVFLCVLTLLASLAPAQEIDFGFERISKEGTALLDWRSDNDAPFDDMTVVSGPENVRSGNHAIQLKKMSGQGLFYTNAAAPVTKGMEYPVTFWVKGRGTVSAQVYLYTGTAETESFHSSVVLPAVKGSTPATGAQEWRECRFSFKTDEPTVTRMRPVLAVNGEVIVDDLSFGDLSAANEASTELVIRPNLISVGLSERVPVIDGVIEPDEYAIGGTGLLNNATQNVYHLDNAFYLSRDQRNLYFAIKVQLPDGYKLASKGSGRDDINLLAGDDVFYFLLRADDRYASQEFQTAYLSVAADGSYYDAWEKVDWKKGDCARDASFNAKWAVKAGQEGDIWTAEISVPLADVKIDSSAKDIDALLSFGLKLKNLSIVWQAHSNWFDHYQAFGQIRLAMEGVTAQMPAMGKLARGELKPDIVISNSSRGEVPYEVNYIVSTPKMVGGGVETVIFDQIVDQRAKDIIRDKSVYSWNPQGSLKANTETTLNNSSILETTGFYVLETEVRADGNPVLYQKVPFRYLPPVTATLTPIPSKDQIKATISLAGAPREDRGGVRIRFIAADGQEAFSHELKGDGDEILDIFSMAALRPGKYKVEYVLLNRGGKDIATSEDTFEKWETPIWLKEQAGIDALQPDWVPAPWTPVETSDGLISVWGRQFTYKTSTLIDNISSQGKPLLSSGATLKYVVAGKEYAMAISEPTFDSKDKGRVTFTQTGDSIYLSLIAKQTIEFDGMNRIDLAITPKRGRVTVDKAWIELPFVNRPYSIYNDLAARTWQSGVAEDSLFAEPRAYRSIWIGDDDVGCAVFFDNYKGWLINSTKPRITLVTKGDSRVMNLLLANEQSDMMEPMAVTIGLQPTPFKPIMNNWRDIRPQGLAITPPPTNLVMVSAGAWNSCDSKPTPRTWEVLTQVVEFLHGRGQKFYPYMGSFFISPYDNISRDYPFDSTFSPVPDEYRMMSKKTTTRQEEFFYFAEDWLGAPPSIVEAEWETRQEAGVTPSSSWTDYFVYNIGQMLERSGLDGLYLDIQQPRISYSEAKGHVVVTKDGVREGTAELYATRDFYKRLYRVFELHRTREQTPWMMGHGFAINPPYSAFWDMNFHGEEIKPTEKFQATAINIQRNNMGDPIARVTNPSDQSYDTSGYRSGFGMHAGMPTMMLPEYGYLPELKTVEHAREMLSITFIHNTLLWPCYIPENVVYDFWNKVEVPFGMGDTEFHPYWKNGTRSSAAYINASYWKKNGKDEYLLAIANWSPDASEAIVELPAELSTFASGVDMESGEQVNVGQKISLRIKGHDLRVIRLTK